ncbi:hypothetical protein C8J57DRAFT_1493598 [Mycena rebaudengoi]|nr:hypothetical protein C8J57DRAFT_1493598 [Mycena rebaudengoi]
MDSDTGATALLGLACRFRGAARPVIHDAGRPGLESPAGQVVVAFKPNDEVCLPAPLCSTPSTPRPPPLCPACAAVYPLYHVHITPSAAPRTTPRPLPSPPLLSRFPSTAPPLPLRCSSAPLRPSAPSLPSSSPPRTTYHQAPPSAPSR